MDTSSGVSFPTFIINPSIEDMESESFGDFIITFPSKETLMGELLMDILEIHQESEAFNDAEIRCDDGILKMPAVLLAAICPVFRAAGGETASNVETFSLILPEVQIDDVKVFLQHACVYPSSGDLIPESVQGTIRHIMNLLCVPMKDQENLVSLVLFDHDWPQISQNIFDSNGSANSQRANQNETKTPIVRQRRRRKASNSDTLDVKIEVMNTKRKDVGYSLRRVIKRKKFSVGLTDDEDEEEPSAKDISPEGSDLELTEDYDSDFHYNPDATDAMEEVESEDETDQWESLSFPLSNLNQDLQELFHFIKMSDISEHEFTRLKDELKKGAHLEFYLNESGQLKTKVASHLSESNPRSVLKQQRDKEEFSVVTCIPCRENFSTTLQIKSHLAKKHIGSDFFKLPEYIDHQKCQSCEFALKTLEKHLSLNEEKEDISNPIIICPHCRRRFDGSLSSFARHLHVDHRNHTLQEEDSQNHQKLPNVLNSFEQAARRCDFCHRFIMSIDDMNRHLISCEENDLEISAAVHCLICGKGFGLEQTLINHMTVRHVGWEDKELVFKCDTCPVACSSEEKLNYHKRVAHCERDPDESFVLHDENCILCSKVYESYTTNKCSKKIAESDLVFQCPHCFFLIRAHHEHPPKHLQAHLRKFHSKLDPAEALNKEVMPRTFVLSSANPSLTFKCNFCSHLCSSREEFNAHIADCDKCTVFSRPSFTCQYCKDVFSTSGNLRKHIVNAHAAEMTRLFKCKNCDFVSLTRDKLEKHKSVHTVRKRRKQKGEPSQYEPCPKCGLYRKAGSVMRAHIKRCLKRASKIKCNDCDLEFKREEDMQAHALIHLGQITCPIHNILFKQEIEVYHHFNKADPKSKIPQLQCCMCDSSFKHMCHLMAHFRRHLKLKPYKCEFCSKTFYTFYVLQVHLRTVHNLAKDKNDPKSNDQKQSIQRNRPFECDRCSSSFLTKGHLKEHIQGVHDQTLVPCPLCEKTFNTNKRMKKHLFNTHKDMADSYRQRNKVETFSDGVLKVALN